MSQTLLFLGATGFVGYPALKRITGAKLDIRITALVRSSAELATELEDRGVQLIEGDATHLGHLEDLASQFDIVIDCIDSAKPETTEAVVKGLKKRGPGKGTLIHISGAGNFWVPNGGKFDVNAKVWDDSLRETISGIDEGMKNGAGDRIVLEAGLSGDINTYIVCPSGVYGPRSRKGFGVFVDIYLATAKQLGYVPFVGEGSAVFDLVHVDDVASLILLVTQKALSGPPLVTVYDRYYIASSQTVSWKLIGDTFANLFHDKNLILPSIAKQISLDRLDEAGPFGPAMTTNMILKSSNAAKLGWKPKGPKFVDSITEYLKDQL